VASLYADEKKDIQDIRERVIKIEATMVTKDELKATEDKLRAEIREGQIRIETRIDNLVYAVLGSLLVFIGIVVWDRRTVLSPAIKKNKELEEREDKLERVLKEIAENDDNVRKALKHAGLLQQ
jgi:predicted DNA-binding ArsR family transcriptional regulator